MRIDAGHVRPDYGGASRCYHARVAACRRSHRCRCRVGPFDGLLVDFAHEVGATAVVKGLRAITDFEYEFQMTAINYQLDRNLETLFIMSTPQHMYLSSSVVREIASMGGDIKEFVPPCVERALREKFGN